MSTVAVFGSTAKGLERRASEVDVLIVAEDMESANDSASRAGAATIGRLGCGLSP